MQRSQPQMLGFGTPPERDDSASVGSNRSHHERDGQMEREAQFRDKPTMTPAVSSVRDRGMSLSLNIGAAHGPGPSMASPLQPGNGGSPTYELRPNGHVDYSVGMPRRGITHNNIWARDNDIPMGGLNVGMGMGVMNTITVGGGGGNGSGFAMMM